ncbi:helicase-associated domain-containing protein [Actinomadura roseirufa]|uniref:helicase-associated domain-containing protein n=1 Tax=Actinomadura roseirufa TaxID=2094049 RepID=UPI0010415902|nr:helicase-associated domain-containing protein [Actinomadura roseirufa]
MTGTPLRGWLATLDQDALAEVLKARPDVCGPGEPDGWGDLAGRLQERRSVERALKRLTRPCLQVVETVAVLGEDATEVRVTARLGDPDEALAALERHALVWPGHDGALHIAETLREWWTTHGGAVGRAPFEPDGPRLPTMPVDQERVRLAAGARLGEFVGLVSRMLDVCEQEPLQVFRAGVKVQALKRVTRVAAYNEASARLAVACAHNAGLLVSDGTDMRLSPAVEAFRLLPVSEQAVRLLFAWWRLPSAPTRTRSDDGGRLNVLSPKADCEGCVQMRRELVTVLREWVSEGRGVRTPEGLAKALDWHRPLACDHDSGDPPHGALLEEAVLLGLVAHGVLSSFGALLAEGDHAGLMREASGVPSPFSERATIGPDLRLTVQGTPSRRLAEALDAFADGLHGRVWKITDASLRRALDSGLSAAGVEAALTAISAGPLPPSLRDKIEMVAAGHVPSPRLLEVPATCVFQSADTDLLTRAALHPSLQGLGVRLLSPGVLVATGPRDRVFAALRDAGYPLVEDPLPAPLPPLPSDEPPPDFDALAERLRKSAPVKPRPLRRPRSVPSGPVAPLHKPSLLDQWLKIITSECRELTSDEVHRFARAIVEESRVRITYVDLSGVETERIISPPYELVRMGNRKKKLLKAICELRSAEAGHPEERNFYFTRVQAVEAVDG